MITQDKIKELMEEQTKKVTKDCEAEFYREIWGNGFKDLDGQGAGTGDG